MSARQHWRWGKKKMRETIVTEPFALADTFVQDIESVEILGSNARITLCIEHLIPGTDIKERRIVDQIVIPIDSIPGCIAKVVKATWHHLTHTQVLEVTVADRIGRH